MHYFRLRPSTIPGAGVGVFATAAIRAGTPLPELFDPEDVRTLTWGEFAALDAPPEVKENFAVRYPDACYLPADLNRPSPGWYLNDSPDPNLGRDAGYNYFALRAIAAGDELFIRYDDL